MNRSAFAFAAAIALTLGSAANAAEPVSASPRAADAAAPSGPTLLASATAIKVPTPQSAVEIVTPVKKVRTARVTSCRCGESGKEGEASPR